MKPSFFEKELSYILESMQGLDQVAQKLHIDYEVLQQIIAKTDPTNGKYAQFIAKLMLRRDIKLPEDRHRVRKALEAFYKFKKHLDIKDINQYKDLHELEETLDPYLNTVSRRKGGAGDVFNLPGVKLVAREGDLSLIKIKNARSVATIGKNTKWCTRENYPGNLAKKYITGYKHLYVILDKNKPIAQITPDFTQFVDRNDKRFNPDEDERIYQLIETIKPPWLPEEVGSGYTVFANIDENFIREYIQPSMILQMGYNLHPGLILDIKHAVYHSFLLYLVGIRDGGPGTIMWYNCIVFQWVTRLNANTHNVLKQGGVPDNELE
jgi:hypothetical protein